MVIAVNPLLWAQQSSSFNGNEKYADSLNREISLIIKNDYIVYSNPGTNIWSSYCNEPDPKFNGLLITLCENVSMPVYGSFVIMSKSNEPVGNYLCCMYLDDKYMLFKRLKKDKNQYVQESKRELENLNKLLKLRAEYDFQKDLENFRSLASNYVSAGDSFILKEEHRKLSIQANALNEEKKFSEALQFYEKNIKANPLAFPGAYYNMAHIAANGGYFGYAILNLKKYLLLKPSADEARKAQDLIYLWEMKAR